jgi:chaperone modulatory protein CbpM
MRDDEILIGSLMENSWLTLEQVAAACTVDPAGCCATSKRACFRTPRVSPACGAFPAPASWRARRMRQLERDFEAVPELAALMADLLEELDDLRARVGAAASR